MAAKDKPRIMDDEVRIDCKDDAILLSGSPIQRDNSRIHRIIFPVLLLTFIILVAGNIYILIDYNKSLNELRTSVRFCEMQTDRLNELMFAENDEELVDDLENHENKNKIDLSLALFKRDVNTLGGKEATVISSNNDETPKVRQKRSNKRRKQETDSQEEIFKIEAVHLHPQIFNDEKELLRNRTSVSVDCGHLVKNGIQVRCEKMNIWELDANSRSNPIVDYINGVVVIKKTGNYYIYSQMSHHDILGSWSYAIMREHNQEEHTVAQCLGMEPSLMKKGAAETGVGTKFPVVFQCNTGRVVRLHRGDQLFIKNMYYDHQNRIVKIDRHLTFWGLMRIGK